jgi:hypothetical protein
VDAVREAAGAAGALASGGAVSIGLMAGAGVTASLISVVGLEAGWFISASALLPERIRDSARNK